MINTKNVLMEQSQRICMKSRSFNHATLCRESVLLDLKVRIANWKLHPLAGLQCTQILANFMTLTPLRVFLRSTVFQVILHIQAGIKYFDMMKLSKFCQNFICMIAFKRNILCRLLDFFLHIPNHVFNYMSSRKM